MTNSNFFLDLMEKKNLLKITDVLNEKNKKLLALSEPESIYNCLKLLEGEDPQADYILINNAEDKSHLVLLNNSKPVICIGYNDAEEYEGLIPVAVNKSNGVNHQMVAYRYILFLKMCDNMDSSDKDSENTRLPEKSEDQKNLSRFLQSLNGEEPINSELKNWWLNRY